MPLVVSVFESADHRGGGADQFGELLLGEACAFAKRVNLACNRIVGLGFRQFGYTLGMPFVVPPMNDLDRVGGRLALLFDFHRLSFLERVELGRLFVSSLSRQRRVDSVAGNSILFGQAMREDCRDSAVKEIENSIVDVLQADS